MIEEYHRHPVAMLEAKRGSTERMKAEGPTMTGCAFSELLKV